MKTNQSLQRMFSLADVRMDELCTSRNVTALTLFFLGVLSVVLLSTNKLLFDKGEEVAVNCAALSIDRAYYGSLCAVIAACMAPMLDLVLELIGIYRQDKKDQEDSPFNNFIIERCVVLMVILVPSIVLVAFFQGESPSSEISAELLYY